VSDDNDLDVFEEGGDESTEESLSEAPPPTPDPSANESKRVDDLMSKWQKAEERAKRAEAALAKSKDGSAPTGERRSKPPEGVDEWMSVAREFAVDQVYRSEPRFERYGIERSRLSGSTPQEIRENAETLTKLVDAIETRARNDALLEHGITPDSAGGGVSTKLANVASMPEDEFEALVAQAKAGGFRSR
jgi:hypothetical protein